MEKKMFKEEEVKSLQEAMADQEIRKAAIGTPGYTEKKLLEEASELLTELEFFVKQEVWSANLINELGDFLFCVLGQPYEARELQARLAFNLLRMERYLQLDAMKANADTNARCLLDRLKLTPSGWTVKEGEKDEN